ncbi:MAG TPA: 1-deoxy-D-xylulose-5-phosphate reductoisomerase [Proteobacteria bacterium]|nr:1-deoxy-D-xylulose-5-phosphate reductoisomerase [Pseudomonadota bacterium]
MSRPEKKIALLGATGSIGRSALDVISRFPEYFEVVALGGGKNVAELFSQAQRFKPRLLAVQDKAGAAFLERKLREKRLTIPVLVGRDGALAVARQAESDLLVAAMVGAIGLEPVHAALTAGKDVALANKESMVMAGRLLNQTAAAHGARILPLDSEHSAIWQALQGAPPKGVAKLILTASGGPFREFSSSAMATVTLEQALCHPRWEMGPKISIDSATMMNKALEIIEARWLFEIDPDRIEVLVHPQSIVHSLVEYVDGSVIAQLGLPDMRLPIAYALGYPERLPLALPKLDLAGLGQLDFHPADSDRFPALRLVREALASGDSGAIAFNAANEVAVELFRQRKIGFLEIVATVAKVLDKVVQQNFSTLAEVLAYDAQVRETLVGADVQGRNSII